MDKHNKVKKKKILIHHFPNLNNYGTGMMGLITIKNIVDRLGVENVEFYCDFNEYAEIEIIKNELGDNIQLIALPNKYKEMIKSPYRIIRRLRLLKDILFTCDGYGFDLFIVLGGDDLSEYYTKTYPLTDIFKKWKSTFLTKVVLLGQTLGPFSWWGNRLAVKWFLPRMEVHARDQWSVNYMKREFGMKILASTDLAYADLPNQKNKKKEEEILVKYNLIKNDYISIVISKHIQGYCQNEEEYLKTYKKIIELISLKSELKEKKILLLPHTFEPYGNEVDYLTACYNMLDEPIKKKVVLIRTKIYPLLTRFLLGNGLFTITGRMHAAVSTFQMGKPAICLSYSVKYEGVIGERINRADLIIEASKDVLWLEHKILDLIDGKVSYLILNYDRLLKDISDKVIENKLIIKNTFDKLVW